MDTALAPLPNQALTPPPDGAVAEAPSAPSTTLARLAAMPAKSKAMLGAAAAGLIAVLVAIVLWNRPDDYKVLFANLSEKDGGAVVAQLSQMNVPYRFLEGGNAILVPAEKVHDVRLKLATAGLPKGSVIGFELMDNARFGQTQFQERLTFQRGLEGELTRSILALGSVEAVRVHLALPNQNGFFREQQKPSASILLTLHPGRTLDRSQIAGIVHLVSSSVPELNPKAVSVLDQTGALLSDPPDGSAQSLDEQQLKRVQQIEAIYLKRVTDILEPVVGRDNLRANVTAELDFSQSESTSEQFRPNQGPDAAAVRSQQSLESTNGINPMPSGVPGAATNQPPVPAAAPINGASQPLQGAQGGGAGGNQLRRENTTNYEVDKTVRVTRGATGTVKRLTAAVVVNHRTTTDPKGKTATVPLTQEELDKLTSLVQESIGFNKDRGDSVKLINAPFRVEPPKEEEDVPLWKQQEVRDLLQTGAVPLSLALVALIIVFGLVRPALKAARPPEPEPEAAPQLDAMLDEPVALPGDEALAALEGPKSIEKLEQARALARENPLVVANIVRGWISGEPA
ncbi:flagellar basal-body MS-ring/collar protein FliF [Aquincola sp. MAHUQ-54]|uniref:Flagellar M-ring protein n=1 Tax=Aquincola agrisoli TaxID=3119538 RepID=A0AAW9QDD1_9BURK